MAEPRKKILIVDDAPALRELAAAILADVYEVREADNGLEALEAARAWRPDLVLTDLMMPVMHGYELCERLRAGGGPRPKIIVVSSKPFATDKSQAGAVGADDYIVKPYAAGELLEKAARLLSGGAPDVQRGSPLAAYARPVQPAPRPAGAGEALPVYVKFWGTRGSCPTGGMETACYGGNTACTEIRIGGVPLIIDCGTGLRQLGHGLSEEFAGRPIEGHIFVGHTHWDHIQGFPFFTPLYSPANRFNVYSVRGAHGSLRDIFSDSMALDYFPVPLSSLACGLNFVELRGAVDIGVASVSFHHLNHPGVCIGFKVEAQGKRIVYISDHEFSCRLCGDNEMARSQDAAVAEFAKGCDLLIMEAQYTTQEYASRKGWGHSTYDDVVKFAMHVSAGQLAIFHHDPAHTDDILDVNMEYCRKMVEESGSSLKCFAAWDGLQVDLC